MPLVNPFDLVDPSNILGTRKTANEKRRDRLIAAQEKYAKIYREAEALGLPLEKMGFPKPVGQILAAGMGGTPGGGGFPAFIPPIVPSQAGGGAVSEQEIEDELRRSEELQNRIDYISSDDYMSRADYEDEINASNVRPPTRIPSIGQDRREWINPYGKGNSDKIKAWKKGKRVISANRVRNMVKRLVADKALTSGTKKKATEVNKLIEKIFADDPGLTQEILDIFNNNDIYFFNTNALEKDDLVDERNFKKIMNMTGVISAIFKNEIIDAINTNLRDGNKPNKEELLKALEAVDTGNLAVGRPGVSTTAILSTPQGRDRVRAVLTEIGLNEDESKDYLETLTNNINSIREDIQLTIGSRDIAEQVINQKLREYLERLRTNLQNQFPDRLINVNSSKMSALFLELIEGVKEIGKAKKGGISVKNIKLILKEGKNILDDIRTERQINPDSFIANRIGMLTRDIDYKIIEEESADFPDLDIDNPQPDPSGLPNANVIITNPNAAMGLLQLWARENNVIGRRGYGISFGDNPPDDPSGDPYIAFATPWGVRKMKWKSLKNFLALTSGLAIASIEKLYNKIKGGNVSQIKITPKDPTTGKPGNVTTDPTAGRPATDKPKDPTELPKEPTAGRPATDNPETGLIPIDNEDEDIINDDEDEDIIGEDDLIDDDEPINPEVVNDLLNVWKQDPDEANKMLVVWKENPDEANKMLEVWKENNEASKGSDSTHVEYEETKTMSEPTGLSRASGIDPAEASLFLHTTKEARNQQKLWDSFSKVEPGFGLGSIGINTVAQHNARSDALRFKNNYKLPQKPTILRPHIANPRIQPKMIPHFMSDFGDVVFEDETPYSDYARRNQLTDERLNSNDWRQYENPNNIYMPEGRLYNFKRQPVIIPEIRNNGYDRFLTNERPSQQRGVVFDDRRTGYHFGGGTMENDDYSLKPTKQKDPTSNIKNKPGYLRYSTRF